MIRLSPAARTLTRHVICARLCDDDLAREWQKCAIFSCPNNLASFVTVTFRKLIDLVPRPMFADVFAR